MSRPAARRYAEALFELARDRDVVGPVSDGLLAVREKIAGDDGLARLLLSARGATSEKHKAVDGIVSGVHPFVTNVLRMLVDRRRSDGLLEMILAFFELREASVGIVRMEVESAREMSESEVERLQTRLAEATGKKVQITTIVNPDLIGGLRIRSGSTLIDGTIKRRIETLAGRLRNAV